MKVKILLATMLASVSVAATVDHVSNAHKVKKLQTVEMIAVHCMYAKSFPNCVLRDEQIVNKLP